MRSWRFRVGLGALAGLGLLAAGVLDWKAGQESQSEVSEQRPASSVIESLAQGAAERIYYQFIDDRNQVRFVTSMNLVPEEWRDRVGYVELPGPPPMSPQDMQRAMNAQAQRYASRAAGKESALRVVLYSADLCVVCRTAKKYMDSEGIDYEERNVDEPRYEAMLINISGGRSIPVFDIDGNILRGFSAEKLDQMIAAAS